VILQRALIIIVHLVSKASFGALGNCLFACLKAAVEEKKIDKREEGWLSSQAERGKCSHCSQLNGLVESTASCLFHGTFFQESPWNRKMLGNV